MEHHSSNKGEVAQVTNDNENYRKLILLIQYFAAHWQTFQNKLKGQEWLVEKYTQAQEEIKALKHRAYAWEVAAQDARHQLGEARSLKNPLDIFHNKSIQRIIKALVTENTKFIKIFADEYGVQNAAEVMKKLKECMDRNEGLVYQLDKISQENEQLRQLLECQSTEGSNDVIINDLSQQISKHLDYICKLETKCRNQGNHIIRHDELNTYMEKIIKSLIDIFRSEFQADLKNVDGNLEKFGFECEDEDETLELDDLLSFTSLPADHQDSSCANETPSLCIEMTTEVADQNDAWFEEMLGEAQVCDSAPVGDNNQSAVENADVTKLQTSMSEISFAQADELQQQLDERDEIVKTLTKDVEILQRMNAEKDAQVVILNEASGEREQMMQQMQDRVDEVNMELEMNKREMSELMKDMSLKSNEDCKKLSAEVASWQTALLKSTEEAEELQRELTNKTKECRSFETRLRNAEVQCMSVKKQYEAKASPQLQQRNFGSHAGFNRPPTRLPIEPHQMNLPWKQQTFRRECAVNDHLVIDGPSSQVRRSPPHSNIPPPGAAPQGVTVPARQDCPMKTERDPSNHAKPESATTGFWDSPRSAEQNLKCEICGVHFPSSIIMEHLRECMKNSP